MASSSRNEPTTRSRTLLFLSYRDSAARSTPGAKRRDPLGKGKARASYDENEESIALLGREEDVRLDVEEEGAGLPPAWADASDQVDEVLLRVKPKITTLDRLHAKHVLPGFTDRTAEEREIEALTTDITRDFRTCHRHIQHIAKIAKSMANNSGTTQRDRLVAQNVQTAMATKVQELSSTFRKKQSVYLQRIAIEEGSTELKGHEIRNQDILAASGSGPWKDSFAALDEDVKLSQNELQSQALAVEQQDSSTHMIDQRDREVTGIAQSIAELAELFKDLSVMVIDQGTLLDRIDYNIETMATSMTAAVKELETATKYQKRSGKRQVIFLLILLIVGALLVLVYKPRGSPAPAPAPPAAHVGAPIPPRALRPRGRRRL